jgi:hypothetical protein
MHAACTSEKPDWMSVREMATSLVAAYTSQDRSPTQRRGVMLAEAYLMLDIIDSNAKPSVRVDYLSLAREQLAGCTTRGRAVQLRYLVDYTEGLHLLAKADGQDGKNKSLMLARAVELLITAAEGIERWATLRRWSSLAFTYAAMGATDLDWHKTALACARAAVDLTQTFPVPDSDTWHHNVSIDIVNVNTPTLPHVWVDHLYDFGDVV